MAFQDYQTKIQGGRVTEEAAHQAFQDKYGINAPGKIIQDFVQSQGENPTNFYNRVQRGDFEPDPSYGLAGGGLGRMQTQALLERQKGEEEGLFKTFETKRAGQEALPTLYKRLQEEEDIPGLVKTVSTVKGEIFKTKELIDRLAEDIVTRTTGFLVTDAGRRRQEAAERTPLSTTLARLATGLEPTVEALTSARGEVGTRLELTAQQQERELEPTRIRIAAIGERFAREMTGFTQDKQNELTLLLAKLQRDQALEDRDWQKVNDLSKEEREWTRTKEQIQLQSEAAIRLKTTPEPKKASVGGETTGTADYYSSGGTTSKFGLPPLPSRTGSFGGRVNRFIS